MGRAIIREPAAFLMDEPLSNLDAKLRVTMRTSLQQLHRRLGTTTVYVTHDQVEAMTLGQRVAVMRDGRIQQVDAPQTLYDEPANVFVAAFIGSPAMNLVEATLSGDSVTFGDFTIPLDRERRPRGVDDGAVVLGIRPEAFEDVGVRARAACRRSRCRSRCSRSSAPTRTSSSRSTREQVVIEDAMTRPARGRGDAARRGRATGRFAARVDARTDARVGEHGPARASSRRGSTSSRPRPARAC